MPRLATDVVWRNRLENIDSDVGDILWPDTRRCFDALAPTLKSDPDARHFVWLYAKRSWLFNASVEQLMKLTRRMPSGLLGPMCVAASPAVEETSYRTDNSQPSEVRAIFDKYRTVCRPGFGMLCHARQYETEGTA